jgi:hypothetical protein
MPARLFGSCRLACELWRRWELDAFWRRKLPMDESR